MLEYNTANPDQISRRESIVESDPYVSQPNLAVISFSSHVHMRGLVAVDAVEEEPIWAGNVRDAGHAL